MPRPDKYDVSSRLCVADRVLLSTGALFLLPLGPCVSLPAVTGPAPRSLFSQNTMLWRTRLSSFAVGFASATAYGAYVLRKDLAKSHEQLLSQARARTAVFVCSRPFFSLVSFPDPLGPGACVRGAPCQARSEDKWSRVTRSASAGLGLCSGDVCGPAQRPETARVEEQTLEYQ